MTLANLRELGVCGLIAALVFVATISKCRALSANDLLSSCEVLVRDGQQTVDGKIRFPTTGQQCWFYMEAVQNMTTLADDGVVLLVVCSPPKSTLLQMVRGFTEYARQNPADLHLNASTIAVRALREAFPCP